MNDTNNELSGINADASFSQDVHYVDNTQQNQGFTEDVDIIFIPKEIEYSSVKKRFKDAGHEHCENHKFITSCSKFLKLVFLKQTSEYNSENMGYINLASNILKNKFGTSQANAPLYYKYIITSLHSIGLIEIDHRYFANKGNGKTKGYRIVLNAPHVMQAVEAANDFTDDKFRNDDPAHQFQLKKLQIDEWKYLFIANLLKISERNQALFVYNYWKIKKYYTKVDPNGRIHSLLTIMPKELRCAFTVEGKAIHEVDLHACQPMLLLVAVKEKLNYRKRIPSSLEELMTQHFELKEYVDRIQSGTFYEHLYRLYYNIKKAPINKEKMADFKIGLFKDIFFSDIKKDVEIKKRCKIFSQVYPIVWEVINQIKADEGYKAIAQTLQRLETEVMNETILRLTQTKPDEFYLRFHDAILCQEAECAFVAEVLNGVVLETIDVAGFTKIGCWGNDLDRVLKSLSLHSALNRKNFFFTKQIGKEKRRKMLSILRDPAIPKADRYAEFQKFKSHYDNSPSNQARLAEMEKDYRSYKFIYPNDWSAAEIESFNKYSLDQLETYFKKMKENQSAAFIRFANSNLERFRKALQTPTGSSKGSLK
jgi:hypothetical protein